MTIVSDPSAAGQIAAALLCVAPDVAVSDVLARYARPRSHVRPPAWALRAEDATRLVRHNVYGAALVASSPDPSGDTLAALVTTGSPTVRRKLAANPDLRVDTAAALLARAPDDPATVAGLARFWAVPDFSGRLRAHCPDVYASLCRDDTPNGTVLSVRRAMGERAGTAGGDELVALLHSTTGIGSHPTVKESAFHTAVNHHRDHPDTCADPLALLADLSPHDGRQLLASYLRTLDAWTPRLRRFCLRLLERDVYDPTERDVLQRSFSAVPVHDDDVADFVGSTHWLAWECLLSGLRLATVSPSPVLLDAISAYAASSHATPRLLEYIADVRLPTTGGSLLAEKLTGPGLHAVVGGSSLLSSQVGSFLDTPGLPSAVVAHLLRNGDREVTARWLAGGYASPPDVDVFVDLCRHPDDALGWRGYVCTDDLSIPAALSLLWDDLADSLVTTAGTLASVNGVHRTLLETSTPQLVADIVSPGSTGLGAAVLGAAFTAAFTGSPELWAHAVLLTPGWTGSVPALTIAVCDMA